MARGYGKFVVERSQTTGGNHRASWPAVPLRTYEVRDIHVATSSATRCDEPHARSSWRWDSALATRWHPPFRERAGRVRALEQRVCGPCPSSGVAGLEMHPQAAGYGYSGFKVRYYCNGFVTLYQ